MYLKWNYFWKTMGNTKKIVIKLICIQSCTFRHLQKKCFFKNISEKIFRHIHLRKLSPKHYFSVAIWLHYCIWYFLKLCIFMHKSLSLNQYWKINYIYFCLLKDFSISLSFYSQDENTVGNSVSPFRLGFDCKCENWIQTKLALSRH